MERKRKRLQCKTYRKCRNIANYTIIVGWLVFYGILTFVGYLMTNSAIYIYMIFVMRHKVNF